MKWNQPPVLNPGSQCYWGWDEPSVYRGQQIVADDWKCTDRRPVTDIHWWGSYQEWDEPEAPPPPLGPDRFHIGIWTDVPAGSGTPWSHPGMMIWETMVPRQVTQERVVGCDFHPGHMQGPDTCFLYSYKLPRETWFYQDPGEHVYWISISAVYQQGPPQQYVWGWKTRPQSVIDAAVRIKAPTGPTPGVLFQVGEPIRDFDAPWDMAFVLTTPAYDYGDAPDAGYRTLLASDGARHIYEPNGPFMGARVDADPDGQPTADASGDDADADGDDEDGVRLMASLVPGRTVTVTFPMPASPADCLMSGWLDVNRDGDFADPNEQIFADEPLTVGGTNTKTFIMPQLNWPQRGIHHVPLPLQHRPAGLRPGASRLTARWRTIGG